MQLKTDLIDEVEDFGCLPISILQGTGIMLSRCFYIVVIFRILSHFLSRRRVRFSSEFFSVGGSNDQEYEITIFDKDE
jgi:hypothetical protein